MEACMATIRHGKKLQQFWPKVLCCNNGVTFLLCLRRLPPVLASLDSGCCQLSHSTELQPSEQICASRIIQ